MIGGRDGHRHPSRRSRPSGGSSPAKLIAGLARMSRDVGLAEELAQDALVAALEQWPRTGMPSNPGPGSTAAAKHRAIDPLRRASCRAQARGDRPRAAEPGTRMPDFDAALDDDIGDDLLRLIFTACHPVLSAEARAALTLRLLGGLTTEEIARAFLSPNRRSRSASCAPSGRWRSARAVRGAARRRARRAARRRCSR